MNIINLDQLISMTSKEIAELTGKRHDNVIRDVR
ncbi:Rha family transcriptional regulator, partial [Acinetobacter baumannii]|nr:Rha family transcriptional regulator [Acinetobacter baumannii]